MKVTCLGELSKAETLALQHAHGQIEVVDLIHYGFESGFLKTHADFVRWMALMKKWHAAPAAGVGRILPMPHPGDTELRAPGPYPNSGRHGAHPNPDDKYRVTRLTAGQSVEEERAFRSGAMSVVEAFANGFSEETWQYAPYTVRNVRGITQGVHRQLRVEADSILVKEAGDAMTELVPMIKAYGEFWADASDCLEEPEPSARSWDVPFISPAKRMRNEPDMKNDEDGDSGDSGDSKSEPRGFIGPWERRAASAKPPADAQGFTVERVTEPVVKILPAGQRTAQEGQTDRKQEEPVSDAQLAAITACLVDGFEYVNVAPPPTDPVIDGLLDRGDKMAVLAGSKMRKTFFKLYMALCLATGRPFFGRSVPRAMHVLYVNLEIKKEHMHRRLRQMARAMGIGPNERRGRLTILNARGLGYSGRQILDLVQGIASADEYDAIIFDPLYKLVEGDENSAKDMKPVLAQFDRLAKETGAAIAYSHHDAKGSPGDRDIRDRGAGSNVIGRDYDTGITLTAHKADTEAVVVHFLCRNYQSPSPIVIRFTDGIFELASDLEPEVANSRTPKIEPIRGDKYTDFAEDAVQAALEKVRQKGDVEKMLKERYSILPTIQLKLLYKLVMGDKRVFTDRFQNGLIPVYLVGRQEDVLAEINRLRRGANERRQPWLERDNDHEREG